MTPFGFLTSRILTHYPTIRALQRGDLPPPRMLVLYPTYRCPARCTYCEYREDLGQIPDMPLATAKALIDELAGMGLESVELCGGGEPTAYPEFWPLINHIVGSGLKLGVLTNGIGLIKDAESLAFLAKHASYVRLSLDAANCVTYRLVKGVEDVVFEQVLGVARRLIALRPKSRHCRISGKFLITPENYLEIADMVTLAKSLGLDSAQFKEVRWTETLSEVRHSVAQALLNQAKQENSDFTIVGDLNPRVMGQKCWLNPLQVTVDADGSVYLCCYFRHRKGSHRIGSLRRASFSEIWGSQQHIAALRAIEAEQCRRFDCRFVDYHTLVDKLIVGGEGQFEFI